MDIVEKTKQYFLKTFKNSGEEFWYLERHLNEVEKWAHKILEIKPEADKEIVMLSVWLHDIGHLISDDNTDHAVNSEKEAKRFLLSEGVDPDIVEKVARCVRAHRCKDFQPESLEAKVLAAADSASHMTDILYLDMASRGDIEEAKAKLERDYKDAGLIPELQEEIEPLFEAWKPLLDVYP